MFTTSTDISTAPDATSNDVLSQEAARSLASCYLIYEESKEGDLTWRLTPIVDIMQNEMPVGAQAIEALRCAEIKATPAKLAIRCIKLDDNEIDVKFFGDERQVKSENELLSVLARVLVQKYVPDLNTKWKITFPDEEEPVEVGGASSSSMVSDLFAPFVNGDYEVVEMVQQSGLPLGMVPRPLVHKYNLLHRGIGMVITKDLPFIKRDAEYPDLYCHRRTDTKRVFPSLYDMFVGGVSLANEPPSLTAAREVAEELGLERALTEDSPLSKPLFDCTVCTSYNRCVVTVFCYPMDTGTEQVTWQEDEVAWGDFIPYRVVQASAKTCVKRMIANKSWPGRTQSSLLNAEHVDSSNLQYEEYDCSRWDFVPDGLLVWEAWELWRRKQQFPREDMCLTLG